MVSTATMEGKPNQRKAKPATPPIEVEDSEEDLAESTPLDLDNKFESVSELESDLTSIPTPKEPVATRSTMRVQPFSRPKQVTSKPPKGDRGCRMEKSLGKHQGNYLMGILLLGKVLNV